MAMVMVMVMAVCEAVAVLFSGFMVGSVTEEECEEKVEPERRHVAVVPVYTQIRQKSSSRRSSAEFVKKAEQRGIRFATALPRI